AVLLSPSPLKRNLATSSGVLLSSSLASKNSIPFFGSMLNFFFPIDSCLAFWAAIWPSLGAEEEETLVAPSVVVDDEWSSRLISFFTTEISSLSFWISNISLFRLVR